MPEFHLKLDDSIAIQLEKIKKLPAGSSIRFSSSTPLSDEDPRALNLINGILPHLKSGHVFVIDDNITSFLADAIGKKLALTKNTILKLVYPLSATVGKAAVRHLGEGHTLWFSAEDEAQIDMMKNTPQPAIPEIVAVGKSGLRLQLPSYLIEETSVDAAKVLPDKGALAFSPSINPTIAAKQQKELKAGHRVSYNAMPAAQSEALAAMINEGCGLEIHAQTRNARALIASLKDECHVKFCFVLSGKPQMVFTERNKELAERLEELERYQGQRASYYAFWPKKPAHIEIATAKPNSDLSPHRLN